VSSVKLDVTSLNAYLSLPRECIYALVCHESKRFLVGHTDHLMGALYRISKDLETPKYMQLKNDIEKIEIVVHKVGVQNNKDKKNLCRIYTDGYLTLGYSQYSPSNLVRYSVHTDTIAYKMHTYLVVYLRDRRCNKVIVGLFRKKSEMDKFINDYYPDMSCKGIYYADNMYTSSYLKNPTKEVE